MPEIVFHPDVAIEIKASYQWYQEQAKGLGDDFLSELESAYDAIAELPDAWPKFKNNFRRFLLGKFPFSVIYRLKNRSVVTSEADRLKIRRAKFMVSMTL